MKRIILLIVSIVVLTFTGYSQNKQNNEWVVNSTTDSFTGEVRWHASSPAGSANFSKSSPYFGTKSYFHYTCNSIGNWAYVSFDALNLENGKSQGNSMIHYQSRIKWDDNISDVLFEGKLGYDGLVFKIPTSIDFVNTIYTNLLSSKTVSIELKWYGQGNIIFTYPMDGAITAVTKALTECLAMSD